MQHIHISLIPSSLPLSFSIFSLYLNISSKKQTSLSCLLHQLFYPSVCAKLLLYHLLCELFHSLMKCNYLTTLLFRSPPEHSNYIPYCALTWSNLRHLTKDDSQNTVILYLPKVLIHIVQTISFHCTNPKHNAKCMQPVCKVIYCKFITVVLGLRAH